MRALCAHVTVDGRHESGLAVVHRFFGLKGVTISRRAISLVALPYPRAQCVTSGLPSPIAQAQGKVMADGFVKVMARQRCQRDAAMVSCECLAGRCGVDGDGRWAARAPS